MKITDSILQELLNLESTVKIAQKRIVEIKEACKLKGSFATAYFVCSVYEQSARRLAPLDEVASVVGMDVLVKNNLINQTTYQVVKVTQKVC